MHETELGSALLLVISVLVIIGIFLITGVLVLIGVLVVGVVVVTKVLVVVAVLVGIAALALVVTTGCAVTVVGLVLKCKGNADSSLRFLSVDAASLMTVEVEVAGSVVVVTVVKSCGLLASACRFSCLSASANCSSFASCSCSLLLWSFLICRLSAVNSCSNDCFFRRNFAIALPATLLARASVSPPLVEVFMASLELTATASKPGGQRGNGLLATSDGLQGL